MLKPLVFRLAIALILVGSILPIFETGAAAYTYDGPSFSANHTSTDITQIPEYWINKAKTDLHIGYGHQSHGEQLTAGMTGLVDFANGHGKDLYLPENIFAWNNGGTGGALDLEESNNGWLEGTCGLPFTLPAGESPLFVTKTREYLGPADDRTPEHADVNVIIWAWCNELPYKQQNDKVMSDYLEPMNQLEEEYQDVTFVYMTARTNHETTLEYNLTKAGNDIIRQYCLDYNKILYDFEKIESYNPDGVFFEYANDNCDYFSSADDEIADGNWAQEWRASHNNPGVDWYYWFDTTTFYKHTDCLNGNLKAYAMWWLLARLAGWDGNPETEVISVTINDNGAAGLSFGSHIPGADKWPDETASPSITITAGSENTRNVEVYLKGTDFTGAGTITINNAFYNNTNDPGTALAMSASYITAWKEIAHGESLDIYHWLSIPAGTPAGTYSSDFTYKAQ